MNLPGVCPTCLICPGFYTILFDYTENPTAGPGLHSCEGNGLTPRLWDWAINNEAVPSIVNHRGILFSWCLLGVLLESSACYKVLKSKFSVTEQAALNITLELGGGAVLFLSCAWWILKWNGDDKAWAGVSCLCSVKGCLLYSILLWHWHFHPKWGFGSTCLMQICVICIEPAWQLSPFFLTVEILGTVHTWETAGHQTKFSSFVYMEDAKSLMEMTSRMHKIRLLQHHAIYLYTWIISYILTSGS